MDDILILDVFWNKQLVRDKAGNEYETFQGKDYQIIKYSLSIFVV